MRKIVLILMIVCVSVNAQWIQMSNGIGNNITIFSMNSDINNIYAGTWGLGLYRSTNNGINWNQILQNNNLSINSILLEGNLIIAANGGNGIYRSTNNGINWQQISVNDFNVLTLASNGSYLLAGVDPNGVQKSTNNGLNWVGTTLSGVSVYSIAFNGNTIFAGVFGGGIFKSTDNGNTWSLTSLTNRTVNAIKINGNNIFAATSYFGVYVSTNNGVNWSQTSLNDKTVNDIVIYSNSLFAGTQLNGIYVSNDNGLTWAQRNEGGLTFYSVYNLSLLNNYLFAGTDGHSIFRRPLNELVGIQLISTEIPNHFSLSQNYPNPFNPNTKIQFAIPLLSPLYERGAEGFITLKVYDALGREIETLVNEQLNPGTYEADWSADNFSSGVYYYKLSVMLSGAEAYTETKKMVVLK